MTHLGKLFTHFKSVYFHIKPYQDKIKKNNNHNTKIINIYIYILILC